MVANSSRKANLKTFLIVIGRRDFYCIVKKMNVGEKQDKRKGSWFTSGRRLSWWCVAPGIPRCSVFCCRGECECGKLALLGRSLPASSSLGGNFLGFSFWNSLRNAVRFSGSRMVVTLWWLSLRLSRSPGFQWEACPRLHRDRSRGGTTGSAPDNKLT